MTEAPLFEALRAEQDRAREEVDYLAQARTRSARRRPKRTLSRPLAVAGALAVAAAVSLSVGSWLKTPAFAVGDARERGEVGAFIAAPHDRAVPLEFADGTRVTLAAGTSARVASLDEQGAHIVLEKGRAHASVVHRAGSRWRLDVGPFQVAVVGTRFDASWDASTRVLELRLQEGAVLVSGAFLRGALPVSRGQTLRAYSDDGRVELLDSGASAAATPAEVVRASGDAPPRASEAPAPDSVALREPSPLAPKASAPLPSWRALASSGKFREALAEAEKSGFDAELQRASGADALVLADAARLAGSATRATQAYAAARAKLPGGGRATYGLGLVAFDQRGDFATAAKWFETYLREQPSGPLRAEATGRLMESLHRSQQSARASAVAAQYLARYPSGAQAALARKLTAQ